MHRIDNNTPDQINSMDDIPSSSRDILEQSNQMKNSHLEDSIQKKKNIGQVISPISASQFSGKIGNQFLYSQSQQNDMQNLNMISETIDEEDELKKSPSIKSPITNNQTHKQENLDMEDKIDADDTATVLNTQQSEQPSSQIKIQQLENKLNNLQQTQTLTSQYQKPQVQKIKKNLFNKQTMKALGVSDSNDKMFGVGPRYDENGNLIEFSIVGKPEWFQKSEGKTNNLKNQLKKQDRKFSKLSAEDRKQSVILQQQTSNSFYNQNSNRRQSKMSEQSRSNTNKKKYIQQKEPITKQSLLWNIQKVEQSILKQQKEENKILENAYNYKVNKTKFLSQNASKTNFYTNQDQFDEDDIDSIQDSQIPPYQFIQNIEKTRQQRQLQKIDQQNNIWEQTCMKIGNKQQRPIQEMLLFKSADKFREKREFQELLQKTKGPTELIGDCYWETLLRQHPLDKKELQKQKEIEEYGLSTDPRMRTLSDTHNTLIRTKFENNTYEIIRKPNLFNSTATSFNSTLQTMLSSNPNKTKMSYYMPMSSANLTGTNQQKQKLFNNTINVTNTNNTFNKSLPSINASISSHNTNEYYKQSFINKLEQRPPKIQKNFENIFQLDCDELAVIGENKLQKEKEALLNDGQPGHAVYLQLVKEEDENDDIDQYQKYTMRQVDHINDYNQIKNQKNQNEDTISEKQNQETINKFKQIGLEMGIQEQNILTSNIEQDSFNPNKLKKMYQIQQTSNTQSAQMLSRQATKQNLSKQVTKQVLNKTATQQNLY